VGAALGTGAIVAGIAVAAGVAAAAANAAGAGSVNPRQLVTTGMAKFRKGDVQGACADFDAAWEGEPRLRPYLWQRGLAHYYVGRYEDGAVQFRSDVAVNPNDTEESIWCFICEARYLGVEQARARYLQVGRDSRPVMRAAYECFRTGASPDQISSAISDNGGHSNFYGMLYVGLWHEAHGTLDDPAAREAITAACATPYAKMSGDYMADLARVHCQQRGWPLA